MRLQGKMRMALDYMHVDHMGLLGPAPRLELWLHGCKRACPGCVAADWNRKNSPTCVLSVGTLLQYISSHAELEGVTISGGEPFLQAEALAMLMNALHRKGLGIILYTGYTLAELRADSRAGVQEALRRCDTLIDGPYVQELDDGHAFRGSANQKIYNFTSRYLDYFSSGGTRRSIIQEEDGHRYLLGIPDQQTKVLWAEIKQRYGIMTPEKEENIHGGQCSGNSAVAPGTGTDQP